MKKIKIVGLLVLCSLLLTGCFLCKKNYTVIFDSKGGSVVQSQTVKKGEKVAKPEDPTKEGYVFDGWYLNENDERPYNFESEVTGSFTLYAKWVTSGNAGEITITFDTNGASLLEAMTIKKGEEVALPTPTKEGYKFVGWFDKNQEVTSTKDLTDNVRLTAKWEVGSEESSEVRSVSLNKSSVVLIVGNKTTVTATVRPSSATDKTVTWKSSDTSVATVKDGVITAVKAGTAKITATSGSKSASINVTVKTKDRYNMDVAKSKMSAKTISTTTSLGYSSSGCTIKMTDVSVNNSKTKVSGENVVTLYRPSSSSYITSKYLVTCGSLKETVSVKHVVSASTYKYEATSNGMSVVLKINGAKNYTLSNDNIYNVKYNSTVDGAQLISGYTKGAKYDMVFDNNANVIYEVVSK